MNALVEELAAQMNLTLDDAESVAANLRILLDMAALFEAVPLDEAVEPLPLFEP